MIKNSQPFGKKFQKTVGEIFFDSHCMCISEGSIATHLRCGGIFSNHLITTNFLTECVGDKNFENRSIFGEEVK